ncbi:MAG: excinuclease ABC subunit UvrA [Thermodesulfobacteriota bacterium]
MEPSAIRIQGARMHNLKNISVDLPRNALVVLTGLSGSGKSTLAFDTLYAEGQRRYVESLSTYARQFLEQMAKPDVDSIEGLSPAVAIEQRNASHNPRSTVGTVTEIYDYLRLLFARVGRPHCPSCGRPIAAQSIEAMTDSLLARPAGTKVVLLAPLVDGKKGEHLELFARLRREGFVRARVDGSIRALEEEIRLEKNRRHRIEAVVDRLVLRPDMARRLGDSVATAVHLSGGFLLALFPDSDEEQLFSEHAACKVCGTSLPELSPQLFSFNSPKGACAECSGLGAKRFFDPARVVPDPTLSLRAGALAPWRLRDDGTFTGQILAALARHYRFSLDTPWRKLADRAREVILAGSGGEPVPTVYQREGRRVEMSVPFEGVIPNLERRLRETASPVIREELGRFLTEQPCPSCQGARLRPEALAVKVGDLTIQGLVGLDIASLLALLPGLPFTPQERPVAERVLKEIRDRLTFLADVGLTYLTLERTAGSLSGGEAQRIRLATQIGTRLAGVLYVLDEPSIGLHQRDNERLIQTLLRLRDLGNTVVVVEHDADTILAADHVLDMGPGAGLHGGAVVYNGGVPGLLAEPRSLTGAYLSGRLAIPVPPRRRPPGKKWLAVQGARANNLKGITARFPVGLMTAVTGVSGSGKSSLVLDTLFRHAMNELHGGKEQAGAADRVTGLSAVDKVIDIDQSPIGRTPRSNPATYTGVLTPIRELFAQLPEARARGYKAGRFSFNLKGGRCEACEGAGVIEIAMHFLPDMHVTCETCQGRRYNRETLEITYRGRSIADVLALSVEEAHAFFANVPAVAGRLGALAEVGLGYISLGQPSTTLSGGEAQRIKLTRELARRDTGRTLYILDEPTTGLHPADIRQLLAVLDRLVAAGNTVVIIEHNLDVVKTADWVIDLGPEGGQAGGEIIACGTPEAVAAHPTSATGRYLQPVLGLVPSPAR